MSDFETYVPETPEERAKTEEAELSAIAASVPVVQEILDWLAEQSRDSTDVSKINVDEDTTEAAAKVEILVAKRLKKAFDDKNRAFELKFRKYLGKGTPDTEE